MESQDKIGLRGGKGKEKESKRSLGGRQLKRLDFEGVITTDNYCCRCGTHYYTSTDAVRKGQTKSREGKEDVGCGRRVLILIGAPCGRQQAAGASQRASFRQVRASWRRLPDL